MSEDLEKLRYPIGRFEPPSRIDRDQIARWIGDDRSSSWRPQENSERASCRRKNNWTRPIVPGAGPSAR